MSATPIEVMQAESTLQRFVTFVQANPMGGPEDLDAWTAMVLMIETLAMGYVLSLRMETMAEQMKRIVERHEGE